MKTAIIYYSMSGNTALTANKLAETLAADLLEIRPEKAYPDRGIRKFLWGGKSAVMAETPKLEPYQFNAVSYDLIVLGFPVWAANMAPPVRSFIQENQDALKAKKIAAFVCQSGSGGEKALRILADSLNRPELIATMVLIDPKDRPKPENDQKMETFVEQLRKQTAVRNYCRSIPSP